MTLCVQFSVVKIPSHHDYLYSSIFIKYYIFYLLPVFIFLATIGRMNKYLPGVNSITSLSYMGNSMPTDTLFCRPIPDFDEVWQAWRLTEETNPYQVSTHFNHF